MQVKVKPVRPGLAKPVHCDAPRVLPLARGANPHIPSGTRKSENSFKVRMYGCNLSDFCITELKACTKGASMYAMTGSGSACSSDAVPAARTDQFGVSAISNPLSRRLQCQPRVFAQWVK